LCFTFLEMSKIVDLLILFFFFVMTWRWLCVIVSDR